MSSERRRWSGVVMSVAVSAATLWLMAVGDLQLYISSRYAVFVTVMAIFGLVASAVSLCLHPAGGHGGTPHAHAERRSRRLWQSGGALISALLVAALVLTPAPVSLSARSATEGLGQDVASSASSDTAVPLVGADTSSFTVDEWATLLAQGATLTSVADATVDVVGFVSADSRESTVFGVTRYVITCCALDAQPVSLPVTFVGWEQQFPVGTWVEVRGGFHQDPLTGRITVQPSSVTAVPEPEDPYVE